MLGLDPKHLETVRSGMWEVVNGDGTAGASRLQIPGVEMCGKTGTAQVRKIVGSQRGQSGDWKYRDHGLFVFFAPFDKPRYAGAVVIEHGMGGARAAAPVAKDVLTFLFDRQLALKNLNALEEQWGGTLAERTRTARSRGARGRSRGSEDGMISSAIIPAAARQASLAADLPRRGHRGDRDHHALFGGGRRGPALGDQAGDRHPLLPHDRDRNVVDQRIHDQAGRLPDLHRR